MANLLFRCVDKRYEEPWRGLLEYVCAKDEAEGWYTVTQAGGVRKLVEDENGEEARSIIARLREVTRLAPISGMVILNHANCAEYAAAGYVFGEEHAQAEQQLHCGHLQKAEVILKREFPMMRITLGYLDHRLGNIEVV